jgi:hypothetical protein
MLLIRKQSSVYYFNGKIMDIYIFVSMKMKILVLYFYIYT